MEVVTALIVVSGVVLTQFVTYLISRQNANDLRVNISREIDIIRKLQPGTEEASKLEAGRRRFSLARDGAVPDQLVRKTFGTTFTI